MLNLDRRTAPDVRTSTPAAAWLSPALHVSLALCFVVLARHELADDAMPSPDPFELAWIASGPLAGGGRHAGPAPGPAPRSERPGSDARTVPVAARPSTTAPEPVQTPVQQIDVPAVPHARGLQEVPGTLSEVTFSLTFGGGRPGSSPGSGDGDGPGLGPGRGGNTGGGDRGEGGGRLEPPVLLRQVRPSYTTEALLARVRGVVVLDAVVLQDGSVGAMRVVRAPSPALGLDQKAIEAVRQWRFSPARRGGRAIEMIVTVEVVFELR